MSRAKLIFAAAFVAATAGGCSTIYFHNSSNAMPDHEEWHHDGLLGLVEFSPPVDLNERCEGRDWETVKTEKTFLNGLVSTVAGSAAGRLYDPWEVAYACQSGPAVAPAKKAR